MGNATPLADLMVVGPKTKGMFLIDVKGQYRKNPWPIKRKNERRNFFYALAFVPPDSPNRFFVLEQSEINGYIDDELKRLNRPPDYSMTGVLWKQVEGHENAWQVLPQ